MSKIKQLLIILPFVPALCLAQTDKENYVQSITMLDAKGTDFIQAVQYYDGLGYPTLSVATAGVNGETAYTLTTYDAVGRENRKYVPVPGTNLDYINESSINSKGDFYNDNSGFTQNHYDALERVTAVDLAGEKWRGAGKQNKTEYLANITSDYVLHYEAPDDGSYSLRHPENTSYQYYPEGILNKVVSYDADNKSVTVFTDMHGHKILERTAAGDTYYVYNVLGQLRFVLSPSYQNSHDETISGYEYRYDDRGRMVKKILPQCGTTQYWYDKADRMAYMRDPALGSRYRFYLYDNLGRLCVQGTCIDGNRDYSILSATTYVSGSDGICNSGYTIPYTINDPKLEIVNYYDNYDFIGKNLISTMPTVTINQNQEQYAIGSQTGLVVYATNGEALGSIDVYDYKGQVVRSVRKGINGFIEDVGTEYTFTGAIDNTVANVNVGYGSNFIAQTDYTYKYGKKTKMNLSLSHGITALQRETEYLYDAIGRLSSKSRQLTTTGKYDYSYSYDIHGWLTGINSNGFSENLYYADGLDGGCYNGNISTMKWKASNEGGYNGYNLKYDGSNRMYSAVYGSGDNLSNNKNYFDEHIEYDCNGNITGLQRSGLVDKVHGSFGMVDNLYMTYGGNRLTSVRDNATQLTYEGATDFNGEPKKEYPLTYNDAGSLISDAGRKIAKIDYDNLDNPVRIQFTNGNVTKYIYSATGEKLRVIYQTAVPNVSVAIGETKELAPSEIQCTDYTDYLLKGNLTLKNGHIDKYQFEEGYCQAEKNISDANKDDFTFCYYDQDHLGNIRQVTKADGSQTGNIVQTINYYPFGMQFCDGTTCYFDQKHKYNGKEFDNMYGLNTYDYGARQYNPVTARWDRMDPLCEKYYNVSPYTYCQNNPIELVDPNGQEITISYLQGKDELSFVYNIGMTCPTDNSFAATSVSVLNELSKYEFAKPVLEEVIKSPNKYDFKNISSEGGTETMQFVTKDNQNGAVINAALLMNQKFGLDDKMRTSGHELYHAFEQIKGNNPATVNGEVDAYLFEYTVYSAGSLGNSSTQGCIYGNAMNDMSLEKNLQENYKKALNNFSKGSRANASGLYNHHRIDPLYKTSILDQIKEYYK